jgi:XTP/dITP diphosphohydrolase
LSWARSSSCELNKRTLLLATTNPGKVREVRRYLAASSLVVLGLQDLMIRAPFPETGNTFKENAREKSLFYSRKSKILTLAEDSGLEIEALDGAPGVYSARFSGPRATDQKNIRKVLSLLKRVPLKRRKARFVSCLSLALGGKVIKVFRGEVRGSIALEERGPFGFGYDPIFFYRPLKKTFAELKPEEKNKVSHRGRALKKLRFFLRGYFRHLHDDSA